MPYKDPQKRKEYAKKYSKTYRQKNHDKIKEYNKEYAQKNQKSIKENKKEYHQKNQDKIKEYRKEYRQKNKMEIKLKNKEYEEKNMVKIKIQKREYHKNIKLKVYNHYSNYDIKCNCCGERQIEFLTLDHINNDGAKHRKIQGTGVILQRWIIKNNYPPIFQLLCFNCNCAKGVDSENICPHQRQKGEELLKI